MYVSQGVVRTAHAGDDAMNQTTEWRPLAAFSVGYLYIYVYIYICMYIYICIDSLYIYICMYDCIYMHVTRCGADCTCRGRRYESDN